MNFSDAALEGEDFVVCALCGEKMKRISGSHLHRVHNISMGEYIYRFPESLTKSRKSYELKSFKSKTVPRKPGTWSEQAYENKRRQVRELTSSDRWKDICRRGAETRKGSMIEANKKRSLKLKEFYASEKGKLRMKEILIARSSSAEAANEKRKESLKRYYQTEDGKKAAKSRGESKKGKARSEEVRRKIRLTGYQKGHSVSEETKRAISRAQKGTKQSFERIRARVEAINRRKDCGDYWENLQKGLKLRPNKFEQKIALLLPDSFHYTGDFNPNGMFKFLNGKNKNADFTQFPDRLKVVECFGDYWHTFNLDEITPEEHECDVVTNYKLLGVDCLVIWERELRDLGSLKIKIDFFLQREISQPEQILTII